MSKGDRSYTFRGARIDAPKPEPGLYIAATPIGNLGDVTIRVLETLAGCDLIACEDTRVTAKLLNHYAISAKRIAYHEHNAVEAGDHILTQIRNGASVALVSDAGTPIVSDPGQRLVEDARAAGIPVTSLPGPTAPVAALVASGMPADTWTFAGFLPNRSGARRQRLSDLKLLPGTLIFFESPNRIGAALADMAMELGGDRRATVARELTKLHEETISGTLQELAEQIGERKLRGEIVVLVAPADAKAPEDPSELLKELMTRMTLSEAVAEASQLTGISRKKIYQLALELKGKP